MLLLLWPHSYSAAVTPPFEVGFDAGGESFRDRGTRRKTPTVRIPRGGKRHIPQVYEERREEVREVIARARANVTEALRFTPNDAALNDARAYLDSLEQLPLAPLPPSRLELLELYLSDPNLPLQLEEIARLHADNARTAKRRSEEEAIISILLSLD